MILTSLGIACLTVLLIDVLPFITFIKLRLMQRRIRYILENGFYKPKRLKPFDCSVCMAFWFSLTYFIFNATNFNDFIFITGVTPIIAYYLSKNL